MMLSLLIPETANKQCAGAADGPTHNAAIKQFLRSYLVFVIA
jgi:hypothetical protein